MAIIAGVSDPKSDGAAGIKEFIVCRAENAVVAGDIVSYSTTNSTAYPAGFAVVDSIATDGRLAGVVTDAGTGAIGDVIIVQNYGYNTNITTDGAVAAADLYLMAGAAVAVGNTAAEVNASITTADITTLDGILGWNFSVDVGTVGQGFITCR